VPIIIGKVWSRR